ncbi:DNA-binding protein RFX2 isoform X2 [Toxorhynchites rutilus septentrionalis]|uniref:DNA-binding protein RFX2 isoform X2 n=1 Tax=Toxorhynchites rutilus septentrionalis TaxID=329112 RepID=UPI00247956C9|nr:DNA-binding protein RFX2 isoform X2 [Toxorhynchites rutilus septentrionalis]
MATRLATQRSFITVTPVTPSTTDSTAVVGTSSVSPAQAATTGPHQNDVMAVSTSPTKTATITIPAAAIQGSSTIKNGTGKTVTIAAAAATTTANPAAGASIIPTSLIANNLSIANILGTQNGGLTLQQIIQQKKIVIHPNGTVIDILPIEEDDSVEDSKLGVQLASPNGGEATVSNGSSGGQQHVTAQVSVVQAQSPTEGGPHYITVTAVDPEADEEDVHSYASLTAVDVSSPDNVQNHHTYVQYVDSDMYSATGQGQTQMTYPVYTVGDYGSAGGQQYYTTGGGGGGTGGGTGGTGNNNYTTSSAGGGGNSHSSSGGASAATNGSGPAGGNGTGGSNQQQQQQYIVPVDEATLLGTATTNGTHQRESPQTMTDVATYIQSHQTSSHHSNSTTPTPEVDQTPNLSHATRVSPATVAWLVENYENAEGVSLPRSTLYNHYMRHCNEHKLDAVNAASFGKLIRSVFTGLRTRRLGTRGNSKYHYYGIRIKPGSALNNAMDDGKPMNASHLNNNNNHSQNHNSIGGGGNGGTGGVGGIGGHGNTMHHRGPKKGTMKNEIPESCAQYLGDASGAIPQFPVINLSHPFPEEITLEDVDTLRSIYREHCEAFLDAILNLDFNTIESLWREFWRAENNNNGDECEEEKYLSKSKLYVLTQCEPIQEFIKQVDFMFYQNMVEVLIPDVLRPIPTGLTQAIRNFAKNLENWLSSAMSGCPEQVVAIKLSAVSAFGQTLRRYTSLNHLAQAARAVLQNGTQIAQMLNDLNRVDFRNVQEQASWICQCDTATVQRLENDFKAALQQQNTLEQWASWLRAVVDDALEEYRGKPAFVNAARQFLLKWSFYSSMVIRDLTLRSAGSFGSFHLIRLLYDEYMFFIIEHKVAEATHTTPIAVMGEKDNATQQSLQSQHQQQQPSLHQADDMNSMIYTSDFEVVNVKLEPSAKRMRS